MNIWQQCQCYFIPNTGLLSELNPTKTFLSISGIQPHRSYQNIEYSSVSLCILGIHLNRFQRSLDQSRKGRWACPTVTRVNRKRKNYQVNNKEKINISISGWIGWDLPWCWAKVPRKQKSIPNLVPTETVFDLHWRFARISLKVYR